MSVVQNPRPWKVIPHRLVVGMGHIIDAKGENVVTTLELTVALDITEAVNRDHLFDEVVKAASEISAFDEAGHLFDDYEIVDREENDIRCGTSPQLVRALGRLRDALDALAKAEVTK